MKKGETSESVKDEGTSDSTSTETLKALVSDLTKKNTKLEQVKELFKIVLCLSYRSQLSHTLTYFSLYIRTTQLSKQHALLCRAS